MQPNLDIHRHSDGSMDFDFLPAQSKPAPASLQTVDFQAVAGSGDGHHAVCFIDCKELVMRGRAPAPAGARVDPRVGADDVAAPPRRWSRILTGPASIVLRIAFVGAEAATE